MMTYVQGNILTPNTDTTKALVVCHQVNCQGVMGSGLAKQIKERFPGVYIAYREKCTVFKSKNLGDVQLLSCLAEAGYIIANVFGQNFYGRDKQYTDYEALRKAFGKLSKLHDTTIRIPYMMGCGLGGGNWSEVLRIIKEELVSKGCQVEIWKLAN